MSAETSVEVNSQQDNPFQAHGELHRKADFIISHSRISRTEVQIVDPDTPQSTEPPSLDVQEDAVFSPTSATEEPNSPESQSTSNGTRHQSDATLEQPAVVEAEVTKVETRFAEHPQQAEQVKLKSKKHCTIQ